MSVFVEQLRRLQGDRVAHGSRTWVFVAYDQLTDDFGPLEVHSPDEVGVVLVESTWKARRRPYHQQKLALILSNQRHFALEQARRGVAVHYVFTDQPYDEALRAVSSERGRLLAMEPAERELRKLLEPLVSDGCITPVPHGGWLTDAETFNRACGQPPWRMDVFYRAVRKHTGILMSDGQPDGGKYSHDADNRQRWDGAPPAPSPPTFAVDPIKEEVCALVRARFADHPGAIEIERLPGTIADAEKVWHWAKSVCMRHFGPYEDAMSTRSATLFHTLISPLLNLHRLLPRRVVDDVLALELPINSAEGFVRQVIGWREFVRHVHRETDGFRRLPDGPAPVCEAVGDAGWAYAMDEAATDEAEAPTGARSYHDLLDGGAAPSRVGADGALPAALWGRTSGLHCLDSVVAGVLQTGYSHHITRLMIISNLGTLLDWSPRALTDWFWCAYIDAYDWVVEPNVLGMGTYAVGDLMTTKPYVSGAAYIRKMSDFCVDCAFDPKKDCPVTHLYWAYLERHRPCLDGNHRLRLPLASARKRSATRKTRDAVVFEVVRTTLEAGGRLDPDRLAERVKAVVGTTD